ncbi:DUF6183 family protein [Kitasatospora sp. NBC_01560]|uniref:DUF6183 family protein n=1 Tax=Kitasatospora sp. NBC_01560 TaxID=2975965 RepID=UPI0038685554
MKEDQARTVAALSAAEHADVAALRHGIDLRVAVGDFDWVVDLAGDIAGQAAAEGIPSGNHLAVLGHLLRRLAGCAAPESLRALLRTPLSLAPDGRQRQREERALAALVAHGQGAEDIERVVYGEQADAVHPREAQHRCGPPLCLLLPGCSVPARFGRGGLLRGGSSGVE